jgi:uncharacterized damage-inducible protein DinB
MTAQDQQLLDTVLDSWERSNTALVNLVRLIPEGGLDDRAMAGSPTIGQMLAHMHHERMVSVLENAPEHAGVMPKEEWALERDVEHIAQLMNESCARVRDAVKNRVGAGRGLDRDFAHPVQLVQFLIFHDGYHHGQIKLALKAAGHLPADDDVGVGVWDVWRAR